MNKHLCDIRLKRSLSGVVLTAKSEVFWEAIKAAAQERSVSSAVWGGPLWAAPDTFGRVVMQDPSYGSIISARSDLYNSTNLGDPDRLYDHPLNLTWIRRTDLNTGSRIHLPGALFSKNYANAWLKAAARALRDIYENSLGTFDVGASLVMRFEEEL